MTQSKANKADFISWLDFYLRVTAIRPTCRLIDGILVLYHVLTMSLTSLGCWILFWLNYTDISINTDPLLYALTTGHTLFVYCIYLRKRKKLCRMVKVMQTRFRNPLSKLKPEKYEEIWTKSDNFSTIFVKWGSYCSLSLFSFYVFNAKPFSPERKLLFPTWIPFSLERDELYFSALLFLMSMFLSSVCIHVAGCGLCIGGARFIGAAFDVLGESFRDLCKNKVAFNSRPSNSKIEQNANEKLKLWVKKHIILNRLVNDYKSVYQNILPEVILSCEIVICFSGFQMVLASEARELEKAGVLAGTVLIFIFHLYMFCYPGQHIYNKSEQLRNTLYSSHWELQSTSFKKHFIFILTNTLRPVDISFKNTIHASMSSFLHGLRTAFSYVNILLVLRRTN